jgi:hypothetical protein
MPSLFNCFFPATPLKTHQSRTCGASFINAEPAADRFAADKPSKYGLATNHSDSKKLYWVFPKIVVPQTKGLPTKLDHV